MEQAYNPPVKKMARSCNFFADASSSFRSNGTGRRQRRTSVRPSKEVKNIAASLNLRHLAFSMVGVQVAARGVHWKIATNVCAQYSQKMIPPNTYSTVRKRREGKMRA